MPFFVGVRRRARSFAAVSLVSVIAVSPVDAADLQPPPACRKAIDARLPGWQLSAPPDDLATYARQKKLTTNVVQADFDDNGTRDTAVLLLAPGAGPRHERQHIAVCLTRGRDARVYLIREPYCGDGISVAPKGTRAHDYVTEKPVTYRTNGVHAYCFEKAGGTYLFRNGQFTLVVDSD